MPKRLTTLTRFFMYLAALFIPLTLILILFTYQVVHRSFIDRTTIFVSTIVQQAAAELTPDDFSTDDPEKAKATFENLFRKIHTSEIVTIKVWDGDARVIYSNDLSVVGRQYPDNEEYLEAIAKKNTVSEVSEPIKQENVSETGYRQLLEVYVPVFFSDADPTSGVVEAYFKLDSVNALISQTQLIIVLAVLAFSLLIFTLLVIFFRRVVYEPINHLKDAAGLIEKGDLKQRVKIRSNDEIGDLATSFNSMAAKLESYYLTLEEKVKERTRSLGESEFRYRRLFETAQDGIVLMNAETGEITDVNPFFEKLLGMDRSEILGKALWEVDGFADGDLGKKAFRELQSRGVATYTDIVLKSKLGKVYIELVGKAYSVGDREFIQCNIRDVTERNKAESRKKELEELKNNFIKIVSHQLRTPLGAVRWNLEEILSGSLGKLPPGQEDLLWIIHKANKEVISRINDMLTALDIEEGRLNLEKSPSQLESLIQSVVEELKGAYTLKKLAISVDLPQPPLSPVDMDPSRIHDVIYKLLDNAVTYTKEGGKIILKLAKANGNVRLEVSDSGSGIPEGEQQHVFQRFHRASNAFTLKPDSSGLGLFIAKHFIEAHGGTIGFKSRENEGSTFWFELPA